MTNRDFNKALDGIDERLISDSAVLTPTKKKAYRKYVYTAAVLAVCIISALCIAVPKIGLIRDSGGQSDTPKAKEVKAVGEQLSEKEVEHLINENKDLIAGTFAAEYGYFNKDIRIFTKGYCHASLNDGTVNLEMLTLPVVADEKIIGTVDVFRDGKSLAYSLSSGGEIWANLNKAFDENPNAELVFAFAGNPLEIAITPDNKIYAVQSQNVDFLDNNADWYSLSKTPYNTFSKNELQNENNYIAVKSGNPSSGDISVNTQIGRAMGKADILIGEEKTKSVSEKLAALSLTKRAEPKQEELPTGGGFVVKVKSAEAADEYVFITENIIRLNGEYYSDSSGSYNTLISELIGILDNNA